MHDIVVRFKKAEVANYNLENLSFDIRVSYVVDGKQCQNVIHITKDDKDVFALAENLVLATRKREKNNYNTTTDDDNPLTGFVNIKIVDEDTVPETLARFIFKVMNQGRSSAQSQSLPRYQIRDQLCKLSVNL